MPKINFEGTASWISGLECELLVKGRKIATVNPPPSFGGKPGFCVPEEIFAAALASCMNTIFLLIAKNSNLEMQKLETNADVEMNIEGMKKLIFTNVHFNMKVKLEKDNDRERKKASRVYQMAQKICPLRQSWGEDVPITFELNFK